MMKLIRIATTSLVAVSMLLSPVAGLAQTNGAPTWNQVGNQSVQVGQTLSITVSASDPDGDALTYSGVTIPANASFNSVTRQFSFTPSSGQAGNDYPVTVRVWDGVNQPVQMTFRVAVTIASNPDPDPQPNSAPVWSQVSDRTAVVGQLMQVQVSATDADGDALTYSGVTMPAHSTFNSTNRTVTFTPTANQIGQTYTFTLRVHDGVNQPAQMSFQVTVVSGTSSNPDPDPQPNGVPAWNPVSNKTVTVGQTLNVTVSATDPDGDALAYSGVTIPANASFNAVTRQFSFTPSSGQANQTYPVTLRVHDGVNQPVQMTFQVSVIPASNNNPPPQNNPPTWSNPGNQTVQLGQTLTLTVFASDPDGDALAYSGVTIPANASFNSVMRRFTFSPTSGQENRSFPVTLRVHDGVNQPVQMTFNVFVTAGTQPQNNPPVWNQVGSRTVQVGSTLSLTVSAFDPDGDSLIYSAVSLPANASFNPSSRFFSFTPSASQVGSQNVTLAVTDSRHTPVQMSFTVFVNQNQPPVDDNDAPVCSSLGDRDVDVDDSISFNVPAFDPDGDNLNFTISNRPDNANFNTSSGFFSFSPDDDQEGDTYFVTFRAFDDEGLSCSTSVQIRVEDEDDDDDDDLEWPFFSTQRLDVGEDFDRNFRVRDHDSRVDYDAFDLPSGADYDDDGEFNWTPRSNQRGTWFITFRAERRGDRATRTVKFIVEDDDFDDNDDFNRRPFFTSTPPTVASFNVFYRYDADARDPDNDRLTFSIVQAPAGAVIDQSTGLVSWIPTFAQAGRSHVFTLRVTDRSGAFDTQSFTVFVQGQVLGVSDPGFPNTGAGGSAANRLLWPLALLAGLSAFGLFSLRRLNSRGIHV